MKVMKVRSTSDWFTFGTGWRSLCRHWRKRDLVYAIAGGRAVESRRMKLQCVLLCEYVVANYFPEQSFDMARVTGSDHIEANVENSESKRFGAG